VKALVVNALGRGFDLEDVDIAAPIGREVLVNVQASGLCHTDLLFATHDIVPTPVVLGHEVAGIVSAVGPEVVQLRVGDHVVGSLAQSCGTCARCLSGRPVQCIHPESTLRRPTDAQRLSRNGAGLFQGFGLGGFAERALIHENQLAVVPKELPFAQAALLGCGVVTGAGSVLNTANVCAGDTVAIFGAGGVGLNAVSGARIAGASRIVVIDIRAKRLDEAKRFGATDIIDSTKTKPVEALRDLLPGGADHVSWDRPPARASHRLANTFRARRDQQYDGRSAGTLGRIQILRRRPRIRSLRNRGVSRTTSHPRVTARAGHERPNKEVRP
jgi:S-(hydroxymethyl)glutathione dehydrogenase/alcohol dehydrogenase